MQRKLVVEKLHSSFITSLHSIYGTKLRVWRKYSVVRTWSQQILLPPLLIEGFIFILKFSLASGENSTLWSPLLSRDNQTGKVYSPRQMLSSNPFSPHLNSSLNAQPCIGCLIRGVFPSVIVGVFIQMQWWLCLLGPVCEEWRGVRRHIGTKIKESYEKVKVDELLNSVFGIWMVVVKCNELYFETFITCQK